MPISSNNLIVEIITTDNANNLINCVIGDTVTFSVLFSNNSLTDNLYNLGFTVSLPDGLSYVGSSEIERTNIINSNSSNIVTFSNIKDLYHNELNYKITITAKVNEYYRATNAAIAFNTLFSNISIVATADSKPRGALDIGNITITKSSFIGIKAVRFKISIIFPPKYLKGAGVTLGDPNDASSIFSGSIIITNNTRSASIVNLNITLANGLRYIGNFSATGTNASTFNNPIVNNVSSMQDHVSLSFSSKNLSAGSQTTLNFDLAIWDKLTLNAVENSGSTITTDYNLISSVSINGNGSSFTETVSIFALELFLEKTVEALETDVSTINNFSISYKLSEYINLSNLTITDIISDGMSYSLNSSSIPFDSLTNNLDGTTTILWNLGALSANSSGLITIATITEVTYLDGSSINATDLLTNTAGFSMVKEGQFEELLGESSVTLKVVAPTISKEVIGYFYEDLTEKIINVGAIGDYVKFKITYDARNVAAKQKNVILFDYPPLNMIVDSVPSNVVVSGDFPPTATAVVTSDNGVMVDLGTLDGGTYFTITFTIPITNPYNDSEIVYNLAKALMVSNKNLSTSVRDSALVYFGSPHLGISYTLDNNHCLSLNQNYNYSITISNSANGEHSITDGFNLLYSFEIPNIFTINNTNITTSDNSVSFNPISINGNLITLNINKLPTEESLILNVNSSVLALPIMGKTYNLNSTLTRGTAQSSLNSYAYPLSNLTSSITQEGCLPLINKIYNKASVKLGEEYTATVSITIPAGCLAYNVKLMDSLLSTDSSNLNSLTLNDMSHQFTLNTNNLIVNLSDTINTSAGPLSYILKYNDITFNANPINFEDARTTTATLNWSEILNNPESLNISDNASISVVVPNIIIEKKQRNVTSNSSLESSTILGKLNDTIEYQLLITNNGKSEAYDISLTDSLPNSLRFQSFISSIGDFDLNSNLITATIANLPVNNSIPVTFTSNIANTILSPIATNLANSTFKANENLLNNYATVSSNSLNIIEDNLTIEKYQRNISEDNLFLKSPINCLNGQTIDFKVVINNKNDYPLKNVVITDSYPSVLSFLSYELNLGNFNRSNNNITISIDNLPANDTVTLLYSAKLNSDYLGRVPSMATINYKFENGITLYSENSNRIYTILSSMGRGFKIY